MVLGPQAPIHLQSLPGHQGSALATVLFSEVSSHTEEQGGLLEFLVSPDP